MTLRPRGCLAMSGHPPSHGTSRLRLPRPIASAVFASAGSGTRHGSVAGSFWPAIPGGGVPARGALRADRRLQTLGSGTRAGPDAPSCGSRPEGGRSSGEGGHLRAESPGRPDARTGRSLDRAGVGSRRRTESGGSSGAAGRHKSWVCRRLALLERLGPESQDELRLGLLSASAARQRVRLPQGNQSELLEVIRREALSGTELTGVVDLLLECPGPSQQDYILRKPREALAQLKGTVLSARGPRLSEAGNKVWNVWACYWTCSGRMEVWLAHQGRTGLTLGDQCILARSAASRSTVGQSARPWSEPLK